MRLLVGGGVKTVTVQTQYELSCLLFFVTDRHKTLLPWHHRPHCECELWWYQVGRGTDWIQAATFVVLCDRQTDRQINTRHYYHGVIGVIVSVGCGGIKSVAVQTQYELPCLLFLT